MASRRDFSSEILALVALLILSALSHFWYIMIAVCAVMALAGMGFVISAVLVHMKNKMMARLFSPADGRNTRGISESRVTVARTRRSSLSIT